MAHLQGWYWRLRCGSLSGDRRRLACESGPAAWIGETRG